MHLKNLISSPPALLYESKKNENYSKANEYCPRTLVRRGGRCSVFPVFTAQYFPIFLYQRVNIGKENLPRGLINLFEIWRFRIIDVRIIESLLYYWSTLSFRPDTPLAVMELHIQSFQDIMLL